MLSEFAGELFYKILKTYNDRNKIKLLCYFSSTDNYINYYCQLTYNICNLNYSPGVEIKYNVADSAILISNNNNNNL